MLNCRPFFLSMRNPSWLLFFLFYPLGFSHANFPWTLSPKNLLQDKKAYTHFKINTLADSFFNENFYRFNLGASVKSKYPYLSLDFDYLYRFTETSHYFKPHEIAIHIPFSENIIFSLGRKRQLWSWADVFWKRGFFEPMFYDDYLRPSKAGLTGLFGNFKYKSWKLTLFGSYIFIPALGPRFKAKDGKVISKNPWVSSLPQQKILSSSPYFRLPDFSLKDIENFILPSAGFKADFDIISFSYIFKPFNQVLIKTHIPIRLDKDPTCVYYEDRTQDVCRLNIDLDYFIIHHHLANINLKLQSEDQFSESSQKSLYYALNSSITFNNPEKKVFKTSPPTLYFQPEKELHFSTKGSIHVKDPIEETVLYLAYTHQIDLDEPNTNKDLYQTFTNIDWQRYFKNEIYYFSQMATAGLEHYLMFTSTEGMDLKTRLNYHFKQKYFLFSFYASIIFKKSIRFFLTGDLLFKGFPFQLSQTREDIGIYSNKSRVFGGISYVF